MKQMAKILYEKVRFRPVLAQKKSLVWKKEIALFTRWSEMHMGTWSLITKNFFVSIKNKRTFVVILIQTKLDSSEYSFRNALGIVIAKKTMRSQNS